MAHILVVEDDIYIQDIVQLYMTKEGYTVTPALDGDQAMQLIDEQSFDLALLDIMLPKKSGWDIAPLLQQHNIPVIFLTARGDEYDKIAGFNLGADDYITKPFSPRELVARIKAVLRRTHAPTKSLVFPGMTIDLDSRTVLIDDTAVSLTGKEFDLLVYLAVHARKVMNRDQLLTGVWGHDFFGDDRTVDVHIKRLRKKIEIHPRYHYIHTVWGVGYKFEVTEGTL